MSDLSEVDVKRIARELSKELSLQPSISEGAAKVIVQTTVQELTVRGMAMLGVNLTNEEQVAELAEDIRFARSLRKSYQRAGRTFVTAIVNALAIGMLLLLMWGILSWIWDGGARPGPPTSISK